MQNPNFKPQFDLNKFKKVCQITSEGSDPYQNLDPMKRIQDATIVYEMEKIFENKLNEFFSKKNDLDKMIPQISSDAVLKVNENVLPSLKLDPKPLPLNEEFKIFSDNMNIMDKLKVFREEFVQIPDLFKEKY